MKLGTFVGFFFGLAIGLCAVALAQNGVDAGGAEGTTALVGGLGSAGFAMSLIGWDKVKGEPARRTELIGVLNTQEERAVAERDRMREQSAKREDSLRTEHGAQLDAIQRELSKVRLAWSALTGHAEVTKVVRAMQDD